MRNPLCILFILVLIYSKVLAQGSLLKQLTFKYEILQLNTNRSTYFREEAIHRISQKHQIRFSFCEIQTKDQGYEFIVQGEKSRNFQVCYDRFLGKNKNWYCGFNIGLLNKRSSLGMRVTHVDQGIIAGSHIGFQQNDILNIKNLNIHIAIPLTYSKNGPFKKSTMALENSVLQYAQSLWLYMSYSL